MWPPAGLLRGLDVFGATSRSFSSSLIGSSSSSEEEELKKSGSSFSMDLSAPEEQPTFNHLFVKRGSASPCVRVSPAAMSMEQKVGELRLAARWSGVFPPNVQALTSARSWKHKDINDIRFTLQVDVKKLRPLLCLVTSVMSRQATLNRFSLTARWRAVFPLFCSGSFILAPPSTSRRRQRSPSLLTAR